MYLSIIPGEEKIKRKKNYAEINSDSAQECVGKMTQILAKVTVSSIPCRRVFLEIRQGFTDNKVS